MRQIKKYMQKRIYITCLEFIKNIRFYSNLYNSLTAHIFVLKISSTNIQCEKQRHNNRLYL